MQDHLGVVVRDADGQNRLWEAGFNGVSQHSLAERILRSKADDIAVRRLHCHRDTAFRTAAATYVQEQFAARPYKASYPQLLKVAVNFHPSKNERRLVHQQLQQMQDSATSLRHALHMYGHQWTQLERRLIQRRYDAITSQLTHLKQEMQGTIRTNLILLRYDAANDVACLHSTSTDLDPTRIMLRSCMPSLHAHAVSSIRLRSVCP